VKQPDLDLPLVVKADLIQGGDKDGVEDFPIVPPPDEEIKELKKRFVPPKMPKTLVDQRRAVEQAGKVLSRKRRKMAKMSRRRQ
jgi:hypothetical protein